MELRRLGTPIYEVAKILGCGIDTVRNDIREVLGQAATQMFETVEETRNLVRTQYEALLHRYQPLAENGNMGAAALVLQITRELRKMEAVDKPEEKKTEETGVRVYVGVDIDLV
jgi:hypothetical protein